MASWLEEDGPGTLRRGRAKSTTTCQLRRARFYGVRWDAARELGFTTFAASELEYYLFQDSYRKAAHDEYRSLQPAGCIWMITTFCREHARRPHGVSPAHLRSRACLSRARKEKGVWAARNQRAICRSFAEGGPARRCSACTEGSGRSRRLSVTFHGKVRAHAPDPVPYPFSLWGTIRMLSPEILSSAGKVVRIISAGSSAAGSRIRQI